MMRKKRRIPYAVPSWGWPEHMAICRCLLTGRMIEGHYIDALFDFMRTLTGVPFIFGFESGETAILAGLKAAGIGRGDRVIMPSFCCRSVANAVVRSGAKPSFCEVQKDLNPDVSSILSMLTPNTKAIIFPHLFGRPGDIRRLDAELSSRGIREKIFLIDDAAQSLGAQIEGRYIGTFGDAGIISFGAGKMTTASGGGLLLTHSESLARRIGDLRTVKIGQFEKLRGVIYWLIFRRWRKYTVLAYRYLKFLFKSSRPTDNPLRVISNVDSAIALSQILSLDMKIAARVINKLHFDEKLGHLKQKLCLPLETQGILPPGWRETFTKYVFHIEFSRMKFEDASKFYEFLKNSGIELQPLYALLHLDPEFGDSSLRLPVTEKVIKTAINLPTDPTLTNVDIDYIIEITSSYFSSAEPCSHRN